VARAQLTKDLREISDDDVAVQTRGPVHEAFAQPTATPLEAGPVVPKAAPDPIPELPPDQKPAGDNVQWIPGYWAWDVDRQDYLWVSGIWRDIPPDRKWVSGYWTKADDGWEWVPGFWGPAAQEAISYITEPPPESLENGPSEPAPDNSSVYVPGTWVYRSTGYVWRPGYWSPDQTGYLWVPATYYSTPAGYVFVDGYWDYPLEDRGLLFTPVTFDREWWLTPGWCYRPSYCVDLGSLLGSLFVQPAYCHYFFGDYYGGFYGRYGFRPWLAYANGYGDPLFNYYRWRNRDNPRWYSNLYHTYEGRLHGTLARPARTLVEQNRLFERGANGHRVSHAVTNINNFASPRMVHSLHDVRDNHLRLTTLSNARLARAQRTEHAFREATALRQRSELHSQGGNHRTVLPRSLPGNTSRLGQPNRRYPEETFRNQRPAGTPGGRPERSPLPETRRPSVPQSRATPDRFREPSRTYSGAPHRPARPERVEPARPMTHPSQRAPATSRVPAASRIAPPSHPYSSPGNRTVHRMSPAPARPRAPSASPPRVARPPAVHAPRVSHPAAPARPAPPAHSSRPAPSHSTPSKPKK
jgi:hypothetical protein